MRRQAIQEQHSLESGWELALLIRRGVVAWMRAWPSVEERPVPHRHAHSCADNFPTTEITVPSSVCNELTSVLVNMILPQRLVEPTFVH